MNRQGETFVRLSTLDIICLEKTNTFYLRCIDEMTIPPQNEGISTPPNFLCVEKATAYYFSCWRRFTSEEIQDSLGSSTQHQLSVESLRSRRLSCKLSVTLMKQANEYFKDCAVRHHVECTKAFCRNGRSILLTPNVEASEWLPIPPQFNPETPKPPTYFHLKLVYDFYVSCARLASEELCGLPHTPSQEQSLETSASMNVIDDVPILPTEF